MSPLRHKLTVRSASLRLRNLTAWLDYQARPSGHSGAGKGVPPGFERNERKELVRVGARITYYTREERNVA